MSHVTVDLSEATLRVLRKMARESQLSVEQVIQSALEVFAQSTRSTRVSNTAQKRRTDIQTEAAAWRSLPEADRQQFGSDYVAVLEGKVIDHDPDRMKLYRRVHDRVGTVPVLITSANTPSPREFRQIGYRLAI